MSADWVGDAQHRQLLACAKSYQEEWSANWGMFPPRITAKITNEVSVTLFYRAGKWVATDGKTEMADDEPNVALQYIMRKSARVAEAKKERAAARRAENRK